jgi:hypothetical protein
MLQRLLMDGIQRCSEHIALRQTRLRETLQNLLVPALHNAAGLSKKDST